MSTETGKIRIVLDHDSRIALRRRVDAATRSTLGLCPKCGMRECLPTCGTPLDPDASREAVARREGYRTRKWTPAELRAAVREVAKENGQTTIHRNLYDETRDPARHPTSNTIIARVGRQVFKEARRCKA